MGNSLAQTQSAEVVNRILLGLENFSQEGETIECNKLFTIVKLSPDQFNLLLAKVYVKSKDFDVSIYRQRLDELKLKFSSLITPNLLISDYIDNSKAIIILRQYCADTLRKKLISPPFLNMIEKMWLSYQALLAVKQMHDNRVFHGDIKSENFLTTSWNWMFLADISYFYKPNFLTEGDLTSYKHYFSYSERPACYLAPEKFCVKSKESQITAEMDIFSLGCVIAEIFLDGQCLFTLPELLSYKRADLKSPSKLTDIKEDNIRSTIFSMISLNPEDRKSIAYYIKCWETQILPIEMVQLYPFMLQLMVEKNGNSPWSRIFSVEEYYRSSNTDYNNAEVLVILAEYITGNIRNVGTADQMYKSIELLTDLGLKLSDDSKLHRILPFLVSILQNKQEKSRVKVSCIDCIARLMDKVTEISARDSHLFNEYFWPALSAMIHDESDWVRTELARSLPRIAKIGRYFFEVSFHYSDKEESYDKALSTFTTKFCRIFKDLIVSKPESQVHIELLSNFAELSEYLDMRSVLNNIIPIVLSWQNKGDSYRVLILSQIPKLLEVIHTPEFFSQILTYIEDGLVQHNELVVYNTLKIFTITGNIQNFNIKNSLLGLVHPNRWIREEVRKILKTLIKNFDITQNYSELRKVMLDYINLHENLIGLITEELLQNTHSPFKRKDFAFPSASNLLRSLIDTFRVKEQQKQVLTIDDKSYPVFDSGIPNSSPLFNLSAEPLRSPEFFNLKGNLQGCFNEHEFSVTNICVLESTQHFLSGSSDGTLKLWSLAQLEPFKHIKSQDFSHSVPRNCKIRSIGSWGDSVFVAHEDGIIFGPLSRLTDQPLFTMNKLLKALAISENNIIGVDQQGLMCIFDKRQSQPAQQYKLGSDYGLVSSLCKGPMSGTLAFGTFSSALLLYDIRFACPSIIYYHSSGLPIMTLQSYTSSSILVGGEDITLLDLNSSTVTVVLASYSPNPIVVPSFRETFDNEWVVKNCYNISHRTRKTFESQNTVRKMLSPAAPYVISGGNDCLVRCWDIANPSRGFIIGQDPALKSSFIEAEYPDVKIVQERPGVGQSTSYYIHKSLKRKEYIEMPNHRKCSHTDAILDIALITQPRTVLLTASRDGTIKAWN